MTSWTDRWRSERTTLGQKVLGAGILSKANLNEAEEKFEIGLISKEHLLILRRVNHTLMSLARRLRFDEHSSDPSFRQS